jgi:glyoxylase-like metal-dependent hydrolase (beta-lactamase superfamily II)
MVMMSQSDEQWFVTREVAPDTYVIAEPGHVNSFLIVGTDRAVLVDTGLGIASIRAAAERLTALPVEVVNTHSHPDHVAGNHEFGEVAIHAAGGSALERQPFGQDDYDAYLAHARRMLDAAGEYAQLDAEFFHLLDAEARPRALPSALHSWTVRPSRATRLLADGDVIDLGGRALTVMATPGHSPDGICLLDDRYGLLVAGDTLGTGPLYAHFPDSDVEAFTRSTARLRALRGDLQMVLIAHFNRAVIDAAIIDEIAAGFEEVAAGEAALFRARDLSGADVQEARFARFSILLEAAGDA